MFEGVYVDCCRGEGSDCVCGQQERVLRAYSESRTSVPMTPDEREWCISEADRAGEGYFSREELLKMTDKELAASVLRAWQMYVQSM